MHYNTSTVVYSDVIAKGRHRKKRLKVYTLRTRTGPRLRACGSGYCQEVFFVGFSSWPGPHVMVVVACNVKDLKALLLTLLYIFICVCIHIRYITLVM